LLRAARTAVQITRQYDIMFANNAIFIYSSQAKNIRGKKMVFQFCTEKAGG
jgi:hypothetical protein